MRTIVFSTGILALALSATGTAAAHNPYADIDRMRVAFAHVQSVTAYEQFSKGGHATIVYTAPDRYRITTPDQQIILTSDAEYLQKQGGTWSRAVNGAEDRAMMVATWQLAGPPGSDLHKLYRITPYEPRTYDGVFARGYHLVDLDGAHDEYVWIGPNDLPMAARIGSADRAVEIRYGNYNGSALIATPVSPKV